MSPSIAVTPSPSISLRTHFLGILRGEFLKIARLFWMLSILLVVFFVVGFWLGSISPDTKLNLQRTPLLFLYTSMEMNLQTFRVVSGILLLVLTSMTIGREFQYGTIRILLARGVGRLQLLFAKLTMLLLIAAALLLGFTIFTALLTCIEMLVLDFKAEFRFQFVPQHGHVQRIERQIPLNVRLQRDDQTIFRQTGLHYLQHLLFNFFHCPPPP